ncbi:CubicO group peptidase (beta-lactamase class C family) [Dyadobacter sp. BE34]|uniref:CubicO group peptidase (Beta-lactamase class C family) n=1 Tax=Dyadobacter fermentans TaxID=94254 RepID=A0ABU1QZU2_9BACT|nr:MULTISPECIES: serine hydrolase domain-containing protein [Dyadobacter]MDR6806674.1 CubicO group peptidase (beta-lactamase class C family) [Dyadobacter fermentans]MDR7044416.1 CubicO group peptidase (beta-lactamase class C family) [Dyadobacter sp. BE242]MDR7198726.1 CubicO group peptidase (beta-lactamase class C family) [Dyadobacter sp. BE34]MDR7216688.1 CubicO group peptidase (beta-lactamase class C family) [Dyadobacter sp. BE31]MDR7263786.1 CubicO group peptidase (beta-lactamase class C fa
MKIKLIPIVALLFAFSASAQQINTTDLDRLFDSLAVHNKSMASVLLTHKGQKVYERAIGYAVVDSARTVKATPETRYRIGSITKTFTATMIMQLVEEKKLALDTHLDKYFPDIPNAGQITIEMMLRHRSGIHNFTDDEAYWKQQTQPRTHAEMLAVFGKYKPDFVPDAEAKYSNTGYILLGYIIEDVTKKSYEKNLQERILARIGLKNTSFGGKIDPARGDAYSYSFSKRWEKQVETDLSQPAGAGAIVSTPGDVLAFVNALFTGKLVLQQSLTQMTKIVDIFGIGLAPMPFYQKKGYGHTGGLDGFQTMMVYFPGDSLAGAVFSNGVDYPLNDILIAMLSAYYKVPVIIPDFNAMQVSPQEAEPYLGVYESKQIPLKVTISHKDNKLFFQPTGQPTFLLTPVKKDVFKIDAVGLTMEFRPEQKEATITQAGQAFLFTK